MQLCIMYLLCFRIDGTSWNDIGRSKDTKITCQSRLHEEMPFAEVCLSHLHLTRSICRISSDIQNSTPCVFFLGSSMTLQNSYQNELFAWVFQAIRMDIHLFEYVLCYSSKLFASCLDPWTQGVSMICSHVPNLGPYEFPNWAHPHTGHIHLWGSQLLARITAGMCHLAS